MILRKHPADVQTAGDARATLAGGSGDDILNGSRGGSIVFGQQGADLFVYGGGRNWVMDFEPGIDSVNIGRPILATTQAGPHLHIKLADGDIYFAWTELGDFDGLL